MEGLGLNNKNKQLNVVPVAGHHEPCAEVLSARTEVLAENKSLHISKHTIKVPVVLAETKIQVDVESCIKLPEPAIEIKRIKKKVFITQCKFPPESNKLFLSGFVRKNIEYATVHCATDLAIAGAIKHATVDVPFEVVTKVHFTRKPIWRPIETYEFEVLGDRNREVNLVTNEHLNEKIFCELVSVQMKEVDIERRHVDMLPTGECTFCELIEKMEIDLCLKVLQYQQVKHKNKHHHHC